MAISYDSILQMALCVSLVKMELQVYIYLLLNSFICRSRDKCRHHLTLPLKRADHVHNITKKRHSGPYYFKKVPGLILINHFRVGVLIKDQLPLR
jgi:hypothetical protein